MPPDPLIAQFLGTRTVEEMTTVFKDDAACRRLLEALVWPDGRRCPEPKCGSFRSTALADRSRGRTKRPGLYQCSACGCQFTVTSGTPLHSTKLPLKTWLHALWLVLQSDKGISSVRLSEAIGVSQKAAWRIAHALRLLMADHETKLAGLVEADEVRVGGKPRKDPANPDARKGKQGHTSKRPVVVAVERPQDGAAGRVRIVPMPSMDQETVREAMEELVEPDAHLMTDGGSSFAGLDEGGDDGQGGKTPPAVIAQDTVTHSQQEYARGIVHTNSAEAMNLRIRRTVMGVFHYISPDHSQGYFDEAGFRWSQRVAVGAVERTTKKGRTVVRTKWARKPPVEQIRTLLRGAVGRRLRRTGNWSIQVISRKSVAYPKPPDADPGDDVF
jgi:transposase-like protein